MTSVMRWNPFDELFKLAGNVEGAFHPWSRPASSATLSSPLAISNDDEGWRVRVPLPGFAPDNVEVQTAGNALHIRAIHRDGDTGVERFEQVMTLPASVDAEQIRATMHHGLLEVMLPYKAAVKPRRVEITTEEPKQLQAA